MFSVNPLEQHPETLSKLLFIGTFASISPAIIYLNPATAYSEKADRNPSSSVWEFLLLD